MGHSVLVVPVPALEPYVRSRWQHYEPDWVSTDPAFTHAHITALGPFHPDPDAAMLADLARVAAATPAFTATLAEVDVFPDGLIHLRPDPLEPFMALTARLHAQFPQFPPYGGAFGDVVPHLTLDSATTGVTVAQVRSDLADLVPVAVRADRLELHWYGEGECRVLAGWPLARLSAPA
ncbi:2'-5' RNA ligase family protein [Nocardioides sp. zg-536]|uniref:2'-5' RNA ligase family protein n=1 Tax=Nocardioides faecalis TaxID=2803858 RepID=A0A938YD40_9ACTN|nr:2'-5' RNA ligase family protein [Nocardioides faecalis]MBM9461659.1 2'-5' RNA ligase family protein [Nocardioides faecalis]MBS4754584.1 2'-5' RNA ligase family protein [Nocardioides faecalis]QVI59927.1 2'-5' RNA ligase family protein [Nocardioides faecalis]